MKSSNIFGLTGKFLGLTIAMIVLFLTLGYLVSPEKAIS
jgi:hypothetical protein